MMKKLKKIILLIVAMMAVTVFSGCEEQATIVSHNISKQADNFNVVRRLTVINTRTDKCILQMTGKMSIEDQTDGIAVLVELDREQGIYQKHYIYMNEWTMYTVEDITGVAVSRYAYEMEFMPQQLIPVKLTANEIEQDLKDLITPVTTEEEEGE